MNDLPIKEKMILALAAQNRATEGVDDIVGICAWVAEAELVKAYMHGREMGQRTGR